MQNQPQNNEPVHEADQSQAKTNLTQVASFAVKVGRKRVRSYFPWLNGGCGSCLRSRGSWLLLNGWSLRYLNSVQRSPECRSNYKGKNKLGWFHVKVLPERSSLLGGMRISQGMRVRHREASRGVRATRWRGLSKGIPSPIKGIVKRYPNIPILVADFMWQQAVHDDGIHR